MDLAQNKGNKFEMDVNIIPKSGWPRMISVLSTYQKLLCKNFSLFSYLFLLIYVFLMLRVLLQRISVYPNRKKNVSVWSGKALKKDKMSN